MSTNIANALFVTISFYSLLTSFSSSHNFLKNNSRPASWSNGSVHMPAALLPEGTRLNTNGAGDAYTSGLLVASMLRHTGTEGVSLDLESAIQFAGLVAANHVDTSTRDLNSLDLSSLLEASIVSH